MLGRRYLLVPSRCSRDPRDPLTLTPSQGQGGCSGEMGRNVGEWRTENQEAPLPLWHYGARKQGRVACRRWQMSVYMSNMCGIGLGSCMPGWVLGHVAHSSSW